MNPRREISPTVCDVSFFKIKFLSTSRRRARSALYDSAETTTQDQKSQALPHHGGFAERRQEFQISSRLSPGPRLGWTHLKDFVRGDHSTSCGAADSAKPKASPRALGYMPE